MSIFCILKAVIAWVILSVAGTNLLGFVVRGLLWAAPSIDPSNELSDDSPVHELLSDFTRRMRVRNAFITFISVIATAACLYGLFYFWNILLVVAALMIMGSRLPDLLWEIREGRRIEFEDMSYRRKDIIIAVLMWGSLLLTWYALCRYQSQV